MACDVTTVSKLKSPNFSDQITVTNELQKQVLGKCSTNGSSCGLKLFKHANIEVKVMTINLDRKDAGCDNYGQVSGGHLVAGAGSGHGGEMAAQVGQAGQVL